MELIKQSQWAKRHGFSRQYVRQLAQSGAHQLGDGLVDVEQADAALAAMRDPSQPERDAKTPLMLLSFPHFSLKPP